MEFSRRSRRVSRAFNPVSPISAAAAARSFAQLEADENDDAVQFCAGDKSEPAVYEQVDSTGGDAHVRRQLSPTDPPPAKVY